MLLQQSSVQVYSILLVAQVPKVGLLFHTELGFTNWMRFIIWLLIGLIIYITYSYKKSKLNKTDLIEYWGRQRLNLSEKSIGNTLDLIIASYEKWNKLIEISFLSSAMKDKYYQLLEKRKSVLQ